MVSRRSLVRGFGGLFKKRAFLGDGGISCLCDEGGYKTLGESNFFFRFIVKRIKNICLYVYLYINLYCSIVYNR